MTSDRSIAVPRETLRLILIAVAVLGLVAVLIAVVQFVQSTEAMNTAQAAAMRLQQTAGAVTSEAAASANALMPLLMQKSEAEKAQTRSLFIGGAGLVAVGIGWLGMDWLRRRGG